MNINRRPRRSALLLRELHDSYQRLQQIYQDFQALNARGLATIADELAEFRRLEEEYEHERRRFLD